MTIRLGRCGSGVWARRADRSCRWPPSGTRAARRWTAAPRNPC